MKPAIIRKPDASMRASSTDELLTSLGYHLLPERPGDTYQQATTRYIHSGGKRGGYAPVSE